MSTVEKADDLVTFTSEKLAEMVKLDRYLRTRPRLGYTLLKLSQRYLRGSSFALCALYDPRRSAGC